MEFGQPTLRWLTERVEEVALAQVARSQIVGHWRVHGHLALGLVGDDAPKPCVVIFIWWPTKTCGGHCN